MRKATLSEVRDEVAKEAEKTIIYGYGCPEVSLAETANVISKQAFDAGVAEFSKLLKAKVEEQRKHARETRIFEREEYDNLCKVFLEYIEECK